MNVYACYIVHYGVEWLYWSIRSVADFVDKTFVFYTPVPSHGHATNLVCPETREQLRTSLIPLMLKDYELHWFDCSGFTHEGEHRTFAVNTCKERGADIVLVVDADEVWVPEQLDYAINFVKNDDAKYRVYCVGMRHFWRSTKWVCDDQAMPTRLLNLHNDNGNVAQYVDPNHVKVLHMGYAQSPKIIEYKQSIHGHKAEWRPGWFENIFLPWEPGKGDVHPTNLNYWTPVLCQDDTCGTMEYLIGDHPYWGMDIIK